MRAPLQGKSTTSRSDGADGLPAPDAFVRWLLTAGTRDRVPGGAALRGGKASIRLPGGYRVSVVAFDGRGIELGVYAPSWTAPDC